MRLNIVIIPHMHCVKHDSDNVTRLGLISNYNNTKALRKLNSLTTLDCFKGTLKAEEHDEEDEF